MGTSGWYYDDWVNSFYPLDVRKSDWLSFYATKFDTVEVNASFYRTPFKNMMEGWKKKTPDDFLLSFKGNQFITHKKKLHDVEEYMNLFLKRINIMEEKLGVVLWQLPPNLKKDMNLLENFLNMLNQNLRHCIEFRHLSWFDEDIYHLLKKYEIGLCCVDAPDLPSIIKVTTDFIYIRWHGVKRWYEYNYTKNELQQWAKSINDLSVEHVFGYFNNDYLGYAPKNCLVLKSLLEKNDK